MEKGAKYEGLKVIHASLFRMGTKSMAEAYEILDYNVHHALDNIMGCPWALLEKAAEAKWPSTSGPGGNRKEFTRQDWDRVWEPYDVATDLASMFIPDLIKAYPEAKVVIVQRDFDSWWPSYKSRLHDMFYNRQTSILNFIGTYFFGIRSGQCLNKMYLGFFQVRDPENIEANARAAYERHFAEVRALVPAERRLEYKLDSGWEPLCNFLGMDVPEVDFPYTNTRKQHQDEQESFINGLKVKFTSVLLPVVVGVVCVWAAWCALR